MISFHPVSTFRNSWKLLIEEDELIPFTRNLNLLEIIPLFSSVSSIIWITFITRICGKISLIESLETLGVSNQNYVFNDNSEKFLLLSMRIISIITFSNQP